MINLPLRFLICMSFAIVKFILNGADFENVIEAIGTFFWHTFYSAKAVALVQ